MDEFTKFLFILSDKMDSPRRNSSQPPSSQSNGGIVLNNGIENGLKNGYVKKMPIPNVMTSPAIIPYNNERLTEEETTDYSVSLSDLPKPPDGGWGWAVVFASFMIHVIGKPYLSKILRHAEYESARRDQLSFCSKIQNLCPQLVLV